MKVMGELLKLAGWGLKRHKCQHNACRDLSVRLLAVYCEQESVHQPAVKKHNPQVR